MSIERESIMKETCKNWLAGPRDGERGFSLIEVMIAVVVLVFGLVSVVGISVYVSRANYTSNTLNVLAAAAQDQVDRLRTAVWTEITEDPTVSVGGAVTLPSVATPVQESVESATPAPMAVAQTTTSQSAQYTYTLNTNDPHRAAVTNTPAGELRVTWQVRQGPTAEIRYVTIRVDQVNAPAHLRDGYTVSTILTRN